MSRAKRTEKRNELVGAFQGPARYMIKNCSFGGCGSCMHIIEQPIGSCESGMKFD